MRRRSLPVFVDSYACRSGVNCVVCRDSGPRGATFRQRMGGGYQLPPGEPFICPHGVELDATTGKKTAMPQPTGPVDVGCGCSPPPRPDQPAV
jgi:hypothetical protein